MHTIEASVLVPLGLGLISILLMLTFYLHDQTVLTAECSALMLEWQNCSVGSTEEGKAQLTESSEQLLITEIRVRKFTAGSVACSLQIDETYQLFDGVLSLMGQSFDIGQGGISMTLTKGNPCWIKRIWKAVEF